MEPALYEHSRCEILLTRYREQAANLRQINHLDLWAFIAFIVIQLLIANWMTTASIGFWSKTAILIIDAALLMVCLQVLSANKQKRTEIRSTILNINEAFALYSADIYLPSRAINPPYQASYFVFFGAGYWIAIAGVVVAGYFGGR